MAAVTNGAKPAPLANHTLYCSNLPDKLQKDDLKRALYMLFTTYGPVLDIVALKTAKMRGQAHVLFRDRVASAQAMRALQDFDFFGKPMKIQYAKSKSDTLAKLDGTYKQPSAPTELQATAVQQSIFAGPPGATTSSGPPAVNGTHAADRSTLAPPPGSSNANASASPKNETAPTSQAAPPPQPAQKGDEDDNEEVDEDDEDAAMDMDDSDAD